MTTLAAALAPLAAFGRGVVGLVVAVGRTTSFAASSVAACVATPGGLSEAAKAAIVVTSRCLVPVVLVTLPLGAMMSLQGLALMRTFGFERYLGPLVAATIVRELSPGFAAVVVAMQGGAGIAAELGAMRAREEIDAMEAMGVDPRAVLAGPRILAAVIAAPILNAIAMVVSIAGAYVAAVPLLGVPHGVFMDDLLGALSLQDVWISQAKCVVFGALLGGVCASAGFHAERGPSGVGRAANRAVVASVVVVLVANYLLNTAVYGIKGGEVAL